HPFMPFFTEEIWSRLPHTEGFVATAPYPRPSDFAVDAATLEDIARLQDAVTEVRRIRGEMSIARKVPLALMVDDDALYTGLFPHARALNELAGVTLERLVERPSGTATAVVRGVECVIPLAGVVDFSSELDRLDKELAKADKDIGQLEKKLGNKGFVDKAPEDVVAGFREKLEAAVVRRDTLRTSRDRLAELV
ncbi:MAG: class I tRNA ligase family protein, partial [Myxococcales bacterium]|nr:class I tRNA ligase family protein [Myxococcales bacterium]